MHGQEVRVNGKCNAFYISKVSGRSAKPHKYYLIFDVSKEILVFHSAISHR